MVVSVVMSAVSVMVFFAAFIVNELGVSAAAAPAMLAIRIADRAATTSAMRFMRCSFP
jgi:hypothetical protein